MISDRSQYKKYLAVASAAVTELSPAALVEPRVLTLSLQELLPGLAQHELRQALSTRVLLRDLGREFCYADDADAATNALALAAATVDMNHYSARVFLDNLAEWMVVPPKVFRQTIETAWITEASAAA